MISTGRKATARPRFSGVYLSEHEIDEIINRSTDSSMVDFSGANLSGDQPLFIVDALLSKKIFSFAHVDVSGSKIGIQGFDILVSALLEFPQLSVFMARNNGMGSGSGAITAKLLNSRSGSLTVLDISGNALGDAGIASIAQPFNIDISEAMVVRSSTSGLSRLPSLYSLAVLDLSDNGIGDVGALALSRSLIQFTRYSAAGGRKIALKALYLHGNKLTDKAAICLSQVILMKTDGPAGSQTNHLALEELGIDDNPMIGSSGITALLGNINHSTRSPLRVLTANRCGVGIRWPTGAAGSSNGSAIELHEILTVVAHNLRKSAVNHLDRLEIELTEREATSCVKRSASRYAVTRQRSTAISTTLKYFIDAVLNNSCTHSVQRVELGALHECLFDACVEASDTRSGNLQADTLHALEHMNSAPDLFGVPFFVTDIPGWIRAGLYDNQSFFRPAESQDDAEHERRLRMSLTASDGALTVLKGVTSPAKFELALRAAGPHVSVGVGLGSSFLSKLSSQLDSADSSDSANAGPAGRHLDRQQGNSSGRDRPSSPNHQDSYEGALVPLHDPQEGEMERERDGLSQPNSPINHPTENSNLFQVKEREFMKLKERRKSAFNVLADEIELLGRASAKAMEEDMIDEEDFPLPLSSQHRHQGENNGRYLSDVDVEDASRLSPEPEEEGDGRGEREDGAPSLHGVNHTAPVGQRDELQREQKQRQGHGYGDDSETEYRRHSLRSRSIITQNDTTSRIERNSNTRSSTTIFVNESEHSNGTVSLPPASATAAAPVLSSGLPSALTGFDENLFAVISSIQQSLRTIENQQSSLETALREKIAEMEVRLDSLETGSITGSRPFGAEGSGRRRSNSSRDGGRGGDVEVDLEDSDPLRSLRDRLAGKSAADASTGRSNSSRASSPLARGGGSREAYDGGEDASSLRAGSAQVMERRLRALEIALLRGDGGKENSSYDRGTERAGRRQRDKAVTSMATQQRLSEKREEEYRMQQRERREYRSELIDRLISHRTINQDTAHSFNYFDQDPYHGPDQDPFDVAGMSNSRMHGGGEGGGVGPRALSPAAALRQQWLESNHRSSTSTVAAGLSANVDFDRGAYDGSAADVSVGTPSEYGDGGYPEEEMVREEDAVGRRMGWNDEDHSAQFYADRGPYGVGGQGGKRGGRAGTRGYSEGSNNLGRNMMPRPVDQSGRYPNGSRRSGSGGSSPLAVPTARLRSGGGAGLGPNNMRGSVDVDFGQVYPSTRSNPDYFGDEDLLASAEGPVNVREDREDREDNSSITSSNLTYGAVGATGWSDPAGADRAGGGGGGGRGGGGNVSRLRAEAPPISWRNSASEVRNKDRDREVDGARESSRDKEIDGQRDTDALLRQPGSRAVGERIRSASPNSVDGGGGRRRVGSEVGGGSPRGRGSGGSSRYKAIMDRDVSPPGQRLAQDISKAEDFDLPNGSRNGTHTLRSMASAGVSRGEEGGRNGERRENGSTGSGGLGFMNPTYSSSKKVHKKAREK